MGGCDVHAIQAFSTVVLALCATVALLAHLLQRCRAEQGRTRRPRRKRRPPK